MPKKKSTNVKQVKDLNKVQIDLKKSLDEDKKIKPEKIFDGYNKTNKSKKKKY